jgi:hypothetical protein
VLLLSVPFPGAVYGALRIAQAVKAAHPGVRIALGGLRSWKTPTSFDTS